MSDVLRAKLQQARALLEEAETLLGQPAEPAQLQPQAIEVTPAVGGLDISWANPAGSEWWPVFLSWGRGGSFLGKTSLAPGSSSHRLSGLSEGTHEVDLGYVVPGVMGFPLTRAQGSPLARLDPPVPSEPAKPGEGSTEPSEAEPGAYPISGSSAARRQAIVLAAGCPKSAQLKTIASQGDLAANKLPGTWVNGQWRLDKGGSWLEGLDVKGLIYYVGQDPLMLRNSIALGVQYAKESGKTGGQFRYVTVRHNAKLALGQGGINFWGQTNWVIDHCDISGFADGVQCNGPGHFSNSWVHDLAYGLSPSGGPTHNDGIQNYGGRVNVVRAVFDMGGIQFATNGALFCSKPSASFVAEELFVHTTRNDVNALHAWESPEGIIVHGGRVIGGRLIGKVILNNVER